ncbi:uncharacterized protein LOC134253314 isoform X2 [Saccostrea cucullata]|uniref:uncharacterized protein LOC134253314 isoform X2 n=1 Tax=Saccostrea cuccullata TaxID=36930 RepID=UPI002ED4BBE1
MDSFVIAACCLFVCININQASGIPCYNCSTKHDPRCGDPFWGGSDFLVECPFACLKVKRSSKFIQTLDRSCSETAVAGLMEGSGNNKHCVTDLVPFKGEVTQCHCTAKGCNSGHSSYSSTMWGALFYLLIVLLFFT